MKTGEMEHIYKHIPEDKIPWNMESPPDALIQLIQTGKVKPCKTIEMGCGLGHYVMYLASKGFNVTGVDISPTAIKMAEENANKKGIKCNFVTADVLEELNEFKGTFDFAYDWEMLHHLFPEKREKYVENVFNILNTRGKYLSVCFSEKDAHFGGDGKYRETPLGTVLYFSSEKEIKDLFEPYFNIIELKTIEIKGKLSPHIAVYAFMEKK